eukprot:m.190565 g.190565  ORF g.190565 m.190565 type:complete len:88 (+) comp18564_c0_seq3:433-696(+)
MIPDLSLATFQSKRREDAAYNKGVMKINAKVNQRVDSDMYAEISTYRSSVENPGKLALFVCVAPTHPCICLTLHLNQLISSEIALHS